VSFAHALATPAYSVHVSIQSPSGSYTESTVPLIVNVTLYFGTDRPSDEVSLQNVTCKYSLDNDEWKNITSMTIISHTSQPDINFWNGLLHKINCTYNTNLEDLSEGAHSLTVNVKSDDAHHGTAAAYFTVGAIPEFPSWAILVLGLLVVTIISIVYRRSFKQGRRK